MPVDTIERYRVIAGPHQVVNLNGEEPKILYERDLGGPHLRTAWNITNTLVKLELTKPKAVPEKVTVIFRARFLVDGAVIIGEGALEFKGGAAVSIPALNTFPISFFNPPIVWGGHNLVFELEAELAEGGNIGFSIRQLTGVLSYNMSDFHKPNER